MGKPFNGLSVRALSEEILTCYVYIYISLYTRPIKDIHSFVGTFTKYESDTHTEPHVDSLSVDNTLWTNTVVASGTAVGLVIYTGSETRRCVSIVHFHERYQGTFAYA